MTKQRSYLAAVIGLLISNVVLLAFLLMQPPHGQFNPDTPKNIVVEKLGFDAAQTDLYAALIDTHRAEIRERDKRLTGLKQKLYAQLAGEPNPTQVQLTTAEMAAIQQEIEQIHFQHFQDIKAICRPEQLKNYAALTKEIADIFSPRHPR